MLRLLLRIALPFTFSVPIVAPEFSPGVTGPLAVTLPLIVPVPSSSCPEPVVQPAVFAETSSVLKACTSITELLTIEPALVKASVPPDTVVEPE